MDKTQTLWYSQPAARWLEALPVGNGRLGAMMHGRVHKEVVQLNEESLWTRPLGRRENPLSLARLGEVRQALLDGDGRRAHFLAELGSFGVPRSQAAYQTLGHLTLLSFGHHEEWANDYRRSLDLRDGHGSALVQVGRGRAPARGFRQCSRPSHRRPGWRRPPAALSRWASSSGGGLTAGARPWGRTSSSSAAVAVPTAPVS